MASLWEKTKFYLGLVDEEQVAAEEQPGAAAQPTTVRRVEPPRPVRSGQSDQPQSWRSQGVAGRRVEPPTRQRRRISENRTHAEAGVMVHEARSGTTPLQPLPAPGEPEAEIVEARAFSDAQALADHIRNGRAVVLDLRNTEPEMVRRLVDFSSGLTYALDGRMAKIAQGVILVTPERITISAAEQERLTQLGLYSLPSGN